MELVINKLIKDLQKVYNNYDYEELNDDLCDLFSNIEDKKDFGFNIIGTYYTYETKDTFSNFGIIIKKLLKNTDKINTLFIYNENYDDYKDFNNYSAGGGNGFMRKYRSENGLKSNFYSLGIPTDFLNPFKNEDKHIKKLIDMINISFYNICATIVELDIKNVIFASNNINYSIGLDIFKGRTNVTKYIGEYIEILLRFIQNIALNKFYYEPFNMKINEYNAKNKIISIYPKDWAFEELYNENINYIISKTVEIDYSDFFSI